MSERTRASERPRPAASGPLLPQEEASQVLNVTLLTGGQEAGTESSHVLAAHGNVTAVVLTMKHEKG